MTRKLLSLLLPVALLFGCAATFAPFTESSRTTIDLSSAVFHLSSQVTLRSLRVLEPLDTKGPFKNDGHQYLTVAPADTGRALAQGAGWITVDFGRGIILRFERTDAGTYAMPGWGTLTVDGERFDVMLGMLSGKEVLLLLESAKPA